MKEEKMIRTGLGKIDTIQLYFKLVSTFSISSHASLSPSPPKRKLRKLNMVMHTKLMTVIGIVKSPPQFTAFATEITIVLLIPKGSKHF